jgi:hypothetical protein
MTQRAADHQPGLTELAEPSLHDGVQRGMKPFRDPLILLLLAAATATAFFAVLVSM